MSTTHEIAFLAIPAVAGPVYAARVWLARRRAGRTGAIGLGDRLPAWGPLPDGDGRYWGPKDVRGSRATVFVFMANRCPGVKAYDARLARLAHDFEAAGVRFLGVNSIPEGLYPSESRARMAPAAKTRGLPFAYVKDSDQSLKRMLGATCTPQAFVVDAQSRLRYRGRIDDAFLEERVTRSDLRDAVQGIVDGTTVATPETRAMGCSIDEAPTRKNATRQGAPSPLAAAGA